MLKTEHCICFQNLFYPSNNLQIHLNSFKHTSSSQNTFLMLSKQLCLNERKIHSVTFSCLVLLLTWPRPGALAVEEAEGILGRRDDHRAHVGHSRWGGKLLNLEERYGGWGGGRCSPLFFSLTVWNQADVHTSWNSIFIASLSLPWRPQRDFQGWWTSMDASLFIIAVHLSYFAPLSGMPTSWKKRKTKQTSFNNHT